MTDLWPDDIGRRTKLKVPATILKEQGSLLGRKTDNLVTGEIFEVDRNTLPKNDFAYTFYLVAPALTIIATNCWIYSIPLIFIR